MGMAASQARFLGKVTQNTKGNRLTNKEQH